MKAETKERVQVVVNILKTGFNWGFLPAVIYFGMTNILLHSLFPHSSNIKKVQ